MSLKRFEFRILSSMGAALAVVLGVSLAGCSSDDVDQPYVERPVEQIYNDGWKLAQDGSWVPAAKQFDEVERQHPYSVWARRAQLMSAYCYYQANQYDDVVSAADRYIQLHPGNKDVPYAYYLKAVSLYEQIVDVNRDQQKTDDALAALQDIVQRFPDTEYARDARLKIDLTRDFLAGKEMTVGRYYLRRGDYVAAINRFRTVVEQYQTTSHTPEALERLTEAYYALGVMNQAQTAAAVLGYNYPGSEWYQDAYDLVKGERGTVKADEESWISKAFGGIL